MSRRKEGETRSAIEKKEKKCVPVGAFILKPIKGKKSGRNRWKKKRGGGGIIVTQKKKRKNQKNGLLFLKRKREKERQGLFAKKLPRTSRR